MESGTLSIRFYPTSEEFINQELNFFNIMTYTMMLPNRAVIGEKKVFFATINSENDAGFELPVHMNIIRDQTGAAFKSPLIMSSASYGGTFLASGQKNINSIVQQVERARKERKVGKTNKKILVEESDASVPKMAHR